jgi:nucleotide-binding universal stress UspA family protein
MMRAQADGETSYRTILVDLSGEHSMAPRLELAKALALRFRATVIGMHVMPELYVPAALRGEAAVFGPELVEAHWAINRSMKERIQKLFQDVLGPEPHVLWRDTSGDRGRLLTVAARTADLVLTGNGDHGTTDAAGVVEQLIMAAGVPVLMLPAAAPLELGRTILVGWNASREATRAVHDALPFLGSAALVVLSAVGSRAAAGLDKARLMLERHGVAVQALQVPGPDEAAGEVLLAQAAAHGADLLVIGSYGRSRLREFLFGGVTRHMLREATVPVLFGS